MKKIYPILLAALAVLAVSCQEGPLESQTPDQPASKTMTFTATVDQLTKVALDGVNPMWENGDAITIYAAPYIDAEGNQVKPKAVFKTTLAQPSTTADFVCEAALENFNPPYYAVYGHQTGAANLHEGYVHNVVVPKNQLLSGDAMDKYSSTLIACSENTTLSFKNAASLLKFKVTADNVQSVKFVVDTKISGEGSVSCDGNALFTPYNNEQSFNEVTLSGKFENGKTYYVAVAPTEIQSLQMFVNGDLAKESAVAQALVRSKIYDMGNIQSDFVKNLDITFYLAPTRWGTRVSDQLYIWGTDTQWDAFPGYKETAYSGDAFNGMNGSKWVIRKPITYLNKTISFLFTNSANNDGQKSVDVKDVTVRPVTYCEIDENRDWWSGWTPIIKPVPEGFTF